MDKNKEMKQGVLDSIKEWMNEYAYAENVCRLYHYYDKQCETNTQATIIGLTARAIYENLIVSLAKFFNVRKNKENNEVLIECEILEKCIKNTDTFSISEDDKKILNNYISLWNLEDYKCFISNIKTRRDTKYAHKDKDKNETVKNYSIWLILSTLKNMLNDISKIFDVGYILDERIVISGLETENGFLNIK